MLLVIKLGIQTARNIIVPITVPIYIYIFIQRTRTTTIIICTGGVYIKLATVCYKL